MKATYGFKPRAASPVPGRPNYPDYLPFPCFGGRENAGVVRCFRPHSLNPNGPVFIGYYRVLGETKRRGVGLFQFLEVRLPGGLRVPAYRVKSPDGGYAICQNYGLAPR